MAMHQGMDLSRFKKIASDDKTSTLRHAKGHEVKIAHSGLTGKMLEHIKGMPVHLAEGGDGIEAPDEQDDKEVLTDIPGYVPPQDGEVPPQQDEPTAAPQQPEKPLVVNDISPSSYIPSQSQQPQAEQPPVPLVSQDDDMDEHRKYAMDIASGKISRRSYGDLFAEKSTLGKIGTLFGLLVSGAGSGLTHQPNMLMEMMNKELDRDLEKQKNANSFLGTQYQHDLQQAQANENKVRTLNEVTAGTGKAAGLQNYLENIGTPGAQNILDDYLKDAHMLVTPARAKAKMLMTVPVALSEMSKNNPAAQAMIRDKIAPEAAAMAQKTLADGHAQAQQKLQEGQQAQAAIEKPVNEDVLNKAIYAGKNAKNMGFAPGKGMIDPDDIHEIDKEKANLAGHRALVSSFDKGFRDLAGMSRAGEVPGIADAGTVLGGLAGAAGSGGMMAGIAAGLGHTAGKMGENYFGRKRQVIEDNLRERLAMTPGMSDSAKEALIKSLLPSYRDDKKDYPKIYANAIQHLGDIEKKMTPTLDRYAAQIPGLKSEFPQMDFVKKRKK